MVKERNKGTIGVSVKLCFRPATMKEKEGRLCYQIIINRIRYQYRTAFRISKAEWNKEKGIIVDSPNSLRGTELAAIEKRTKWEMRKILEIANEMAEAHLSLVFETIIQKFEEQKARQSFTSFIQAQIERLQRTGRIRTSETYLSTYHSFMAFRKDSDIQLFEFDTDSIEDYESYLRAKGLTPNSSSFYLRILRTVLNKAVKQGLMSSCDFFGNVYTGISETAKRAIGVKELKRIKTLDFSSYPKLDFARDMFLLSVYFRGMSFIDMANLKLTDLRENYLVYHRKKTGKRLEIKWERQMAEIIQKYPPNDKYLLPLLRTPDAESRKYFKNRSKQINRWLKKIGEMAEIQIPLTMYVARHTWASIAKQKNIPIGVISNALGHNSEKTTQIYLSTLDTSAVDDANSQILAELQ